MVFYHLSPEYAGGLLNTSIWLGINFNERCRSPRNKYGGHLAVSAPICGNATARFGNYYDISSVSSVASWEDVLVCKPYKLFFKYY